VTLIGILSKKNHENSTFQLKSCANRGTGTYQAQTAPSGRVVSDNPSKRKAGQAQEDGRREEGRTLGNSITIFLFNISGAGTESGTTKDGRQLPQEMCTSRNVAKHMRPIFTKITYV
jgi:hypothetical protein